MSDEQPLATVKSEGLRRQIEHLETRHSLPSVKETALSDRSALYNKVCGDVSLVIKDVPEISCTTDIWASGVCGSRIDDVMYRFTLRYIFI